MIFFLLFLIKISFVFIDAELKERIRAWKRDKRDKKIQVNPNTKS